MNEVFQPPEAMDNWKRYPYLSPLLMFLVSISVFSTDLYITSFPLLAESFTATPFQTQLSLSVYLIGLAISMLICVPVADTFGYRKTMLIGLFTYTAASLGCALSSSIESFIFFRFLQSFGGCCGSILSRILVQKYYGCEKHSKLFAYLFGVIAATVIIAPLLGSFLCSQYGWRANFFYMSLYVIFLFIAAYKYLPETTASSFIFKNCLKEYKRSFSDTIYLKHTLIVVCLWTGFFTFIAKAPFYFIKTLQFSTYLFAIFYSIVVFGMIIGTMIVKKLSPRKNVNSLLSMGVMISLISSLALIFIYTIYDFPFLLVIPLFGYHVGLGIALPNCQAVIAQHCQEYVNVAFSIMFCLKMLGGALGGVIVIALSPNHLFSLIGILVACALVATGSFFSLNRYCFSTGGSRIK